ncbi:anthranilate synthase component I family protein [Thalassococcus sp. BH17M4-6]|uniref:anthranilate synthase component I family protein n=1 Tax=Thalassococcus sp. BH17M4-6 TaxID=3413148 RepID=UPI003BE557F8
MTPASPPPMTLDWMPHSPQEMVLGHDIDLLELFWRVKQSHAVCYLFESVSHPRHQDRFHVLGFAPAVELLARDDTLTLTGCPDTIAQMTGQRVAELRIDGINPYTHIAQLRMDRGCRSHQGGLIGFFSHEAMNYFEPAVDLAEHPDFATFRLGLYLDGLILDTVTQSLSYYTFGADRSDEVRAMIAQMDGTAGGAVTTRYRGDSETRDSFLQKVADTQQKIFQGYSFQAEVGMKSRFDVAGDKFTLYRHLREVNPSPYMYYLQFGQQELFGASPEILISSKSGRVLTTPTAGTIHRGKDASEDVILARKLLSDPKEIAEHNMLVDLHRNDISMVCQPGTVVVEDLMYLIKFSHVQHIVSNVVGVQARGKTAFDVLRCILPGGVVTGAPKIETVKIIQRNEAQPRGPYGGAVGRFAFNGDCDFCMPIRSLFCNGDDCFAQTSAGVVYDSDPAHEYQEVQRKLAAMRTTLAAFGAD